jgi:hypothetical protein
LPAGTAIAVFGQNGLYSSQHCAILLGKTATGIYVCDQNWVLWPKFSIVGVHFIPVTRNGGVGDALSYYEITN